MALPVSDPGQTQVPPLEFWWPLGEPLVHTKMETVAPHILMAIEDECAFVLHRHNHGQPCQWECRRWAPEGVP